MIWSETVSYAFAPAFAGVPVHRFHTVASPPRQDSSNATVIPVLVERCLAVVVRLVYDLIYAALIVVHSLEGIFHHFLCAAHVNPGVAILIWSRQCFHR